MKSYFTTDYLLPTKIIDKKGDCFNQDALFKESALQISLNEQDLFCFKGKGYLVLDFGREIAGGIRILSHYFNNQSSSRTVEIRIRFGESLMETYSQINKKGATNDHSPRDFKIKVPQLSDIEVGNTGFRFVRIDFYGESELYFKNIYAAFKHLDKKPICSFTCNDDLINKIFDTSVYTAFLCVQNGMVYDGIKRDRLVWEGDLHPEILALSYMFGELDCVENSLSFSKNQNKLPSWMSGIPAYSVWWIIVVFDYYYLTGKRSVLKEHCEYIKDLLIQINGAVDEEGNLNFSNAASVGAEYFLDWNSFSTPAKPSLIDSNVSLLLVAASKAKLLLEILNEDQSQADDIIRKLKKIPVVQTAKKQFLAIHNWAGRISSDSIKNALETGGAKGLSTFMSYYILRSLSLSGEVKKAIDIMKEYYGGMLSRGATTFWEDFNIEWLENSGRIDSFPKEHQKDIHGDYGDHCYKGFRHSLCHGWSAGPVPFLIEFVAGIKNLQPGFRQVLISPNLGNLKEVKVSIPTPQGILTVHHKKINGQVSTKAFVPKGMNIKVENCILI